MLDESHMMDVSLSIWLSEEHVAYAQNREKIGNLSFDTYLLPGWAWTLIHKQTDTYRQTFFKRGKIMISDTMCEALNEQFNAELYSSYLYLSMSAWFSERSLSGFASWMRIQTQEEVFHAMKIYDYILERGGSIALAAIEKPENDWKNEVDVVREVVAHEAKVTAMVNNLVEVALAEKDHATNIFLQWFVTEQVEEEASVGDVLGRVKMIQGDSAALFALDLELGKRVYTSPSDD